MNISSKDKKDFNTTLNIAKRRCYRVWSFIGIVAIAALIVYALGILSAAVSVLLWTMIFVFCLRGIVNKLEKKGVNRAAGTAISYVVFFVVIGAIAWLIFSPMFGLGGQFVDLITSIPAYVQSFSDWFSSVYNRFESMLTPDIINWLNSLLVSLGEFASSIAALSAETLVAIGGGIAGAAVNIGLALVIAFWVLMELPALGREAKRLIAPEYADDAELLHATFTRVMGGYISVTLTQCVIVGIGLAIVFLILGVPNAAALAFIAGLFTILPIIGPFIGGAFVCVVCLLTDLFMAIIAVIAVIVIENFVFTFVTPRIMSNSIDVHPALSLFVVIVGSSIGGAMGGFVGSLLGMLAAVPATAVIRSLFVYYFEKSSGRQIVAEDGVLFKGKPSTLEGEMNALADATASHPGITDSLKLDLTGTSKFKLGNHTQLEAKDVKDPYEPQTPDVRDQGRYR